MKPTNHVPFDPLSEGFEVRTPALESPHRPGGSTDGPLGLRKHWYRIITSFQRSDLLLLRSQQNLGRQEMENDLLVSSSRLRYCSTLP